MALSDVAKGLNALFKPKPGRLGIGLPFDEDTYAAAKPYFQAGLEHFRQAGADIVEMMRALIVALRDQFGMDKDTIAAMKPYVLRYISDVQAGREAIEETNPQQLPKDKLQQQQAAESIDVIVGDKANIDATLPFLTEGQREDVLFAEKRWAAPDGYGVLFTNGTGTGKTFLALGAIKRLTKQGKGKGIIVVPNEAVMNEWVKSAPALGLQIKPLSDTQDAGSGIAITTYANFGQNDEIAKRDYDFVAIDEAHLLMLGKDAEPTKALDALRAVSLHPDGVLQRAEMQNRELVDRISTTSDQLKSLYRMMNNPDIMDQMYAAYRAEADGLEKQLAADRAKWKAVLDAVESDVMARQGEKRTRAIFLSATPFAYEPSIQWGEGYLYEFPKVSGRGYNAPNGYQKFMMQHFGWRMRNGKLNKPPAEVDSDLMQRQFNTWLRKEGVLSARMLDVDFDYERKFILIQGGVGQTIDDGLRWLRETDNGRYWSLYGAINEQFDYLTRSRLLEAIKARAAIPYIKKHHALGRKVVVFYDFNSGGGINVFNLSEQLKRAEAAEKASDYSVGKDGVDVPVRGQGKVVHGQIKRENVPRSQLIREFMAARPELQAIDFSQYGSPLTTLLEAFPGAGVYNGMSQYKKTRVQSIRDFNDDAKPEANLLLVQKAANAGWSGHDTTGKHGRVLINLGLPVAPIEAIQEEGRIYRVGQKSDANLQYFNTGTNWERYAFGSKIARRAGTAENLAMGEQARGLREAFIQAFENSDPDYEPGAADGRGGKAGDRDLVGAITEWDRARSLYFAQQKRTSRTKAAEGVDYYATPEPLGLKMVEWAGILTGESVLEPSAGHGAIARWFPEKSDRTVIEPSLELASRLTLATDAKLINERFEGHDTINKYDAIVMNPPFGTGGKTAIEHLDKAFRHLTDGGRVVALIPEGPTANKRFEDWLYGDKQVKAKPVANDVGAFGAVFMGDTVTVEVSGVAGIAGGVLGTGTITGKVTGFREGRLFVKRDGEALATGYRPDQIRSVQPTGARTATVKSAPNAYLRASIGLPGVTFERAGTGVKTRVVIIDKIEGMRASRGVETQPEREIEAATVKELFDRLENMEVVGRSLPAHKEQERKQGQERSAAKDATAGKADDVGLVQPDGSPATIEQLQKPEKAGGKTKLLTDAPRVKHVVARSGKELFGVIAKRLTRNEAKAVDPYSWPKDGGFFIRMEHVVRPPSVVEQGTLPTSNAGGNVAFSAVSSGIAASPADRAIYSMAAEGKSTDEILSFI
ncbi:MAG TPA: DEAD/DEAH box helicase family protein, partial [Azospira sp.]|nr:DEAD/DEAH box helicase family protein [Azospira sp.]